MASDQNTPNSGAPVPPDPPNGDGLSDCDLDEMLQQAASLAQELSEEAGSSAPTTRPNGPEHGATEPLPDDSSRSGDADKKLDDLERLVAETARQVDGDAGDAPVDGVRNETDVVSPGDRALSSGEPIAADQSASGNDRAAIEADGDSRNDRRADVHEGTEEAPDAPSGEQSSATTSSADLEIPDFLSEFTQPAAPDSPEKPPATDAQKPGGEPTSAGVATGESKTESASLSGAKPGVVGTTMTGTAGTLSPAIGRKSTASLHDGMSEANAEEEEPNPSVPDEAQNAGTSIRLAQFVSGAANRVVPVLERIDRPFGFFGAGARRAIGWVALSILPIAILLYILSWTR